MVNDSQLVVSQSSYAKALLGRLGLFLLFVRHGRSNGSGPGDAIRQGTTSSLVSLGGRALTQLGLLLSCHTQVGKAATYEYRNRLGQ